MYEMDTTFQTVFWILRQVW